MAGRRRRASRRDRGEDRPGGSFSAEIDQAVRAQIADGRSLYAVDSELIDTLAPDVIVTQDLCAVCAVSSGELASACPSDARVISLDPRTLADVAETVLELGDQLDAREAAETVVEKMWAKIAAVEEAVAGRPRPRVFLAEWIDPPFCPGHWIPEMIERAGGECVLGEAGEPSHPVTWDDVLAAGPELVVVAPCGFGAEEAAERSAGLDLPVRAVAVDGDAYFSRPAPRLADGVRQLGHLLHPRRGSRPSARRDRTLTRLLSPGGNTVRHGRATIFTTRRARLARRARRSSRSFPAAAAARRRRPPSQRAQRRPPRAPRPAPPRAASSRPS